MLVILLEAAVLALFYDSLALAVMAIVGALLTPLLMQSPHDQYQMLFTYLVAIDIGVVLLMVLKAWPVVGTLALVGTHGLYWTWHLQNYHPEKSRAKRTPPMCQLPRRSRSAGRGWFTSC
jgi:uncharacterized membrane protein